MLDDKEQIIQLIITEEGKKLLAQNKFEIVYYAFGDDEIDYQVPTDNLILTGSFIETDVIVFAGTSLATEDGEFVLATEDGQFIISTEG